MDSIASAGRGSVSVYLLDDHALLRRGLRDILEDAGITVAGEAGTAREAATRIPALRPDVAILDVRLPDGSGIEVCREVRAVDPDIAVLMLTSFDDDTDVLAAIMAGAAGYVLKDLAADEIVDAVGRVAAGQSILDPAVTARVLHRVRHGAEEEDPLLRRLTGGERTVLGLLAEGLTNRQIATRTQLSEKTVKNYVSELLAKLGMSSRTQAAVYAVEHRSALDPSGR